MWESGQPWIFFFVKSIYINAKILLVTPKYYTNMDTYKSKFMEVIFHKEKATIEFSWSNETVTLTDNGFREELEQQVRSVEHYKPSNVLIDTTEFIFPISPDTQAWVDAEIYPAWARAGVSKMGFLMSPELISQLSIQQAVDENSQKELQSGFFETKEEALAWFQKPHEA